MHQLGTAEKPHKQAQGKSNDALHQTILMSQFNFMLTKSDFDAQPWEDALATCEEPSCSVYCVALKRRLDEAKAKTDAKAEQVYTLLHAASSLCFDLGSPKQPFRPAVILEKIRSAAVEDFGASDGAVLAEIAAGVKDPEFRARICDVVWVIRRDYRMARLAIPAYVESAKRLEQLPRPRFFVERFRRAIQLAMMVGQGDSALLKSVTDEIELIIDRRLPAENKWTCADLMHTLIQAGVGDPAKFSAACQMMEELQWHRGLMVDGGIKPALHVINSEHFVAREDLAFLVENNPFVPPAREGIFLRGLHAGVTGDLLTAAHLLIPQVENSIRYLLANYAHEPRTSTLKDNLAQLERDLNELLYHED